jgi:hypothetical protein
MVKCSRSCNILFVFRIIKLFSVGLQRMRSKESAEVRALVQALAGKIAAAPVSMDAQGIGSALYGTSLFY